MLDRNGVGDTTWFLNDSFFALLNKHFIDNSNHLTGFGMVQRTATVSWVSGGVKLKNVIGGEEPSQNLFLQELSGELWDDDRCDCGNNPSMGHRIESKHHADGKPSECIGFTFSHFVRIAERHRNQWLAGNSQYCNVMGAIFGDLGRFTDVDDVSFAGEDRDDFFSVRIDFLRQDVSIGDDMEAIRDDEPGAAKDRGRPTSLLECSNADHSRPNFFDSIWQPRGFAG